MTVLYLTLFIIPFILNSYIIASGRISREELAQKAAINRERFTYNISNLNKINYFSFI